LCPSSPKFAAQSSLKFLFTVPSPAGFGEESKQQLDGCVAVDVSVIGFPTARTFCLRVIGDSMIGNPCKRFLILACFDYAYTFAYSRRLAKLSG